MKIAIILLTVCFIPSAHAYIDPGSGSFILQMLIASLIGAVFTFKMYIKNFKEKLRKIFSFQQKKSPLPSEENKKPERLEGNK